jgi:hypothetical protein
MKLDFRITTTLLDQIHIDLSRPHRFAAERVGFVACRVANLLPDGLTILAESYLPVAEDGYEDDPTVGAMMNSSAIRNALQHSFRSRNAMFHIHRHEHFGLPEFSTVDLRESKKFVPDFWKVQSGIPHGALVLSKDKANGLCWHPTTGRPTRFDEFWIVGATTKIIKTNTNDARL